MGRRTAAAALTVTMSQAVALTGCGAVEKALDCARTAMVVVDSVERLEQAVSDGVENPAEAARALDEIDRDLDRISDQTDNVDVDQAVEDMRQGLSDARQDLDEGRAPRVGSLARAGEELTTVCSPG